MNKQERFKDAYDFLRGKGYFHTQKEAADKMHTTQQNMSAAIKGIEKVLTDNFIIRFCAAFDNIITPEWIISGSGTMTAINGNNNAVGHSHVVVNDSTTAAKLIEEMAQQRIAYQSQIDRLVKIIENLTNNK